MTGGVDERGLAQLLRDQDGVVARHQLLALAADDDDIARLRRRHALTRVHPGVYVDHTGRLSEHQRRWAAVLACWPAALTDVSALPRAARPRASSASPPVHVAVDRHRHLRRVPGVVLHRVSDLDSRVAWHCSPPRVRVEHAVLDVASAMVRRDKVANAFGVLAGTCQTCTTTPERIAAVLDARARVTGRRTLEGMLADLALGTCSVLERGFVQRVERPHGLPSGTRQRRRPVDGGTTYADVDYDPLRVLVVLDGLAFHDGPEQRDRDAARDLANCADSGAVTVRLTYGLVFDTPAGRPPISHDCSADAGGAVSSSAAPPAASRCDVAA